MVTPSPETSHSSGPFETTAAARALGGLLLLLCLAAAYHRALTCGFIWDDDVHLTRNALLGTAGGLWSLWTDTSSFPQYYPLTFTTFWLEYRLWGLNPLGYHLVNAALHLANTLLIWTLLRRLGMRWAWLAALIFAIHPAHVETVAWITERKNLLSALLYLASFRSYLNYLDSLREQKSGGAPYASSLALFALALTAKSVAATLPAALLLILWWKKGRLTKTDLTPLLPFFALGVGFGLFAATLEHRVVGAGEVDWGLTWPGRLILAGRIALFYPADLLLPTDWAFFRAKWRIDPTAPLQYLWPLTAAALTAGLYLGRRKLGRGPLTGWLYYLGTIFPVLGFLKVYPMKFSYVADHFQYLASIGTITLAVALLHCAASRLSPAPRQKSPYLIALVLALLLIPITIDRIGAFADEETLWIHTIAQNPKSTIAYNNLGNLLFATGNRHEEVIFWSEKAIREGVEDADILVNLGGSHAVLGRFDEAHRQFLAALNLNPSHAGANYNLGLSHALRGETAKAARYFEKVVALSPVDPWPHFQLGLLWISVGNPAKARIALERALSLDPGLQEARSALAGLGKHPPRH